MRVLLAILTVTVMLTSAASIAAAQTNPADTVVTDGLALPRDHRYEIYDTATKKYNQIQLDQVPQYVRQGQRVYDRTAKLWVLDPSGKLNQRYVASGATPGQPSASAPGERWNRSGRDRGWDRNDRGGLERTSGAVVSIKGDEVVIREDGGRQVTVNMAQARTRLRRGLQVGDHVSVVGVAKTPDYIEARAVREPRSGNNARQGQQQGQDDDWARIHGRVQSVEGNTMRLRTDDGRTLTVDLAPVDQSIRQALRQGESVTVIGYDWTGSNQLRAEYVQQDSSDPSRGGSVAPSASPKGR
jgi:hypothetical protein